MTFRMCFAALVLLSASLSASADPAAALDARANVTAAEASAQAVSAAMAREDADFQRAIDRKLEARIGAVLVPPMPLSSRGTSVAVRPVPRTNGSGRELYAVK